ncbi:Response regulator receiver domain-containing protein [Alkalispirochaeta americana]|uniref:Response regulator receiver domain-containing protein n=1 Tax=Alkalispirochaeta americana TaxID=159291 RepID=A0A1N6R231_9SPIO|nr:response regulator [Alkalispirochaeta americana]SIQ22918.1 Response regulator receiver domain-containing protein [Alkalispirochaeta americana]
MSKQAILCVDDEVIILMALKQELRSHFKDQFIYEGAGDAQEALETINELERDGVSVILIISDWLMPGIKGDEFLFRVNESHPNIAAIMVTGHADPESIQTMRERLGDIRVIHKPWRHADIINAVQACLTREDPNQLN